MRKGIISYEKLLLNGPVVEVYGNKENSIYADIYEEASKLVERIVESNRNLTSVIKKSFEYEGANVISFIGRRGLGKTSAMLSFANILEEYTRADNYAEVKNFFKNREFMRNTAFYCLDYIDASAMEESEDVFILVLANMFNKALLSGKNDSGRMREYDNRQLFQKFETVYNNFMTLNTKIKEYDEYSPFEKLENVGNSQRIRNNFAELVQIFLKMTDSSNDIGQDYLDRYLVIIIDDLDIAKRKKENNTYNWGTYKIMSTIYKYLMVPRVIILTAYDHERLVAECEEYYIDQRHRFGDRPAGNDEFGNDKIKSEALQYMEKIFPIFSRLYMPSWRKRDLQNESKIKINIQKYENLIDIDGLGMAESEKNTILVKNFIFMLLAKRTFIYFDTEGKKRHFLEPDTLRTLYNYTQLIVYMSTYENIPQTDDNFPDTFESNIRKIKEDCYFRFKYDKLQDPKESELFNKWLEEPFERRGAEIVATVCRNIEKLGKSNKERYKQFVQAAKQRNKELAELYPDISSLIDNSNVEYSYAELVHGIYHMTRDHAEYSRGLVACILYSYTIHLTEIYTKYRWHKSRIGEDTYISYYRKTTGMTTLSADDGKVLNEIEKHYQVMKTMMGPTVCGKWSEYYFPMVKDSLRRRTPLEKKEIGPYIMGYREKTGTPFSIPATGKDGRFSRSDIKAFLFLAMLHTKALEWTEENIKWIGLELPLQRSTKEAEDEEILKVQFSFYDDRRSDFDMTGFLKHSFCYAEFLGNMENILLKSLDNEMENIKKLHEEMQEELRKKSIRIKESVRNSFSKIWKEYYHWDKEYGNMMLPLYSLDITYNAIKRVFQECRLKNPETIDISEGHEKFLYTFYEGMLKKFQSHLQTLDKDYRQTSQKSNFEKAFLNCPVYQYIINDEKKQSVNYFQEYMSKILKSVALDEGYLTSPEG